MTDTQEAAVERVARAICEALGFDPNKYLDEQPIPIPGTSEPSNVIDVHRQWQLYMPVARAAIAAMPDWQDIETAPRDGTKVLLWWGGDYAPVGSWQCFEGGDEDGTGWVFGWVLEDGSLSINGDGWLVYEDEWKPTHWAPAPPEDSE